jgi:hypothetical protein
MKKLIHSFVNLFLAGFVLFSVSIIAAEEGMMRADYDEYLALFNANDPSFIKFYHPDVVLDLNGSKIRGAQGIKDFYADVKKYISEKVEVTTFIRDGDKLAVEIPTTFEVIADWDDSFWGVPLKKGQVLRIVSWGIYDIEDGKFKTIRTARYKLVNDWQFEK